MAEELKAQDLEGKSLEELEALEDELVASNGEDQGRDDDPNKEPIVEAEPVEPAKKPTDPADPPLPGDAAKVADPAGEEGPPLPTELAPDPAEKPGDPEPQDQQHVSPPSKWMKDRHERNALKERLEVAEQKAEEADGLKGTLEQLQKEMAWMKTALAGKKVDIPTDPLEVFTEERLSEVQDEFGNEVADMFRATKAILGGDKAPDLPVKPADQTPAQGEQPTGQPTDDQPLDPEIQKVSDAIASNDHLVYWAEVKPELYQRATAIDAAWLKHPQYLGLSYEDRFKMVVKQVQDEQVAKGINDQKQGGEVEPVVPTSLSGSPGEVVNQGGMTPYERVMAANTDEAKEAVYKSLPEADRDAVDLQLGI